MIDNSSILTVRCWDLPDISLNIVICSNVVESHGNGTSVASAAWVLQVFLAIYQNALNVVAGIRSNSNCSVSLHINSIQVAASVSVLPLVVARDKSSGNFMVTVVCKHPGTSVTGCPVEAELVSSYQLVKFTLLDIWRSL